MDDLGNRTGIQTLRGGGTDEYSVDSLTNRYTAIDASPLAYDPAGNLTQDKDDYLYTCDYENRITKIEKPDGPDTGSDPDPVAEFAYDTQGRRIRVFNAVAGKETLYYYSDNWQVLLSVTDESQNGSEWKLFVYGNYIDEVLRRERYFLINGQKAAAGPLVMYYLHDHLYSPAALVDSVGTVFERYEYDAYGKVAILSMNYEPRTTSLYANAYYFTGRELDVLDNGSLKIMYYRARYYDPQTGRFMQRDPLEYVESPNIYEYVLSCPIGLLDPYGERSITYEANFPQTPAGFSAYFRVAISVSDCPVEIEGEIFGALEWQPPGLRYVKKPLDWVNLHIEAGLRGGVSGRVKYSECSGGLESVKICGRVEAFARIDYRKKGHRDSSGRFTRLRFGAGADGGGRTMHGFMFWKYNV
jgi:RHS repeat-associated protein